MTARLELIDLPEPTLMFGYGQRMEHPKDGLLLYGPSESPRAGGSLRIGVVATEAGVGRYSRCVSRLAAPIAPKKVGDRNHTHFPGFAAVFGIDWPAEPAVWLQVDAEELERVIRIEYRHQAIHAAVSLYSEAIVRHLREGSESGIDFWMVVVPETVYRYCRPESKVERAERERPSMLMNKAAATRLLRAPGLFEEDNVAAEIYLYELDFHNQHGADCRTRQRSRGTSPPRASSKREAAPGNLVTHGPASATSASSSRRTSPRRSPETRAAARRCFSSPETGWFFAARSGPG